MGYDLHITRTTDWSRSSERPISEEEWCAAADAWPGMSRHDRSHYALAYPGERSPGSLYWREGEIVVRVWKVEADVARLAESLNAYLIGDEGERYYPDSTVRRSGEFPPDIPPGEAQDDDTAIALLEPRTVTAAQAEAIRAWRAARVDQSEQGPIHPDALEV
ncbi:hypothetical protein KO481_35840 [Nocardia sp. NEAU-G5]|uniref:Uncharacterized protein n=1 Tax=Nocardia albiluteola TaxID=2842303 RepID=A0ABS6BBT8_9NOCA|nr:hypothetical protein [Nocardia albiluteola]MBU3066880.1 hypothetical protein [Nocardia albiluteola]